MGGAPHREDKLEREVPFYESIFAHGAAEAGGWRSLEGLVLPIRFFRDGAEARAGPTAGSCAPLRREL